MRVRFLRARDRSDAAEIWQELERRSSPDRIACSWDWTVTWLEHYGPVVEHCFAVGERDDGPAAVVLLTRETLPWSSLRSRVVHLGTAGERAAETVWVERNAVLALAGAGDAFARALLCAVGRRRRWQRLQLDGFLPEEAAPFAAAAPRLRRQVEACPVVDLAAARVQGGDVLALLGTGTQRRIRRSLRAFGPLEGEWCGSTAAALAALDELIALHGARWRAAGRAGAFASPRTVEFHRAVISRLAPSRRAFVFCARTAAGAP